MANKWLAHVKKTMKVMKRKGTYKKGMGLSQVIKEAKKDWKSHKKGGAEAMGEEPELKEEQKQETEEPSEMEAGRRRRGARKTKRHGKSRRH
jgi:hypothetical protein